MLGLYNLSSAGVGTTPSCYQWITGHKSVSFPWRSRQSFSEIWAIKLDSAPLKYSPAPSTSWSISLSKSSALPICRIRTSMARSSSDPQVSSSISSSLPPCSLPGLDDSSTLLSLPLEPCSPHGSELQILSVFFFHQFLTATLLPLGTLFPNGSELQILLDFFFQWFLTATLLPLGSGWQYPVAYRNLVAQWVRAPAPVSNFVSPPPLELEFRCQSSLVSPCQKPKAPHHLHHPRASSIKNAFEYKTHIPHMAEWTNPCLPHSIHSTPQVYCVAVHQHYSAFFHSGAQWKNHTVPTPATIVISNHLSTWNALARLSLHGRSAPSLFRKVGTVDSVG